MRKKEYNEKEYNKLKNRTDEICAILNKTVDQDTMSLIAELVENELEIESYCD